MVVKVESETTEVAPCQFPHLVAQHCIAYTYGIRWGRTYTTLNKKSNVPQVESESWDDSMESKCSSGGVENESKNENQSKQGETTGSHSYAMMMMMRYFSPSPWFLKVFHLSVGTRTW